jgi:hypothetical protein
MFRLLNTTVSPKHVRHSTRNKLAINRRNNNNVKLLVQRNAEIVQLWPFSDDGRHLFYYTVILYDIS